MYSEFARAMGYNHQKKGDFTMLAQTYFDKMLALSDDELLAENDHNRMKHDLARANMMSARSLFEQTGDLDTLESMTSKFDIEHHKYQLSQDALIRRDFVYREKDHVFDETGWYKKNQCSQCGKEVIGYSMCDDCWED